MDYRDVILNYNSYEVKDEPIKYESNDITEVSIKQEIVSDLNSSNEYNLIVEDDNKNYLNFIKKNILGSNNCDKIKVKFECDESSDTDNDDSKILNKTENTLNSNNKWFDKLIKSCLVKNFRCIHCEVAFNHKGDLKRHIESQHMNIKRFRCYYCPYSGSRKGSLKKHIIVKHMRTKAFACRFCDYRGGSSYHLKRHVTMLHVEGNLLYCSYCNFNSKYKESIRKHLNRFHLSLFTKNINNSKLINKKVKYRKKLHKCLNCDFKSTTPGRVRDHNYAKHDRIKPYTCNLCKYCTSFEETLKRHVLVEHNNKYKCSFCVRTFSSKKVLANHESKIHVKSFRVKSDMYYCSYCFEGFYCKDNLRAHLKLRHRTKF